jgi:membrane fusion protein (multidrug efflux system)
VVADVMDANETAAERYSREPGRVADRPREPHGLRARPARGRLSRRLLAATVAVPLGLLAVGSAYLYWDYGSHFETTDDAFIAARQFGIAPKVSGYISAVPVTDNEHVATGQVIAQIDPRDYKTALAQAGAQVAAAQANIENINAQIAVQQAQVAAAAAQVAQAQATLTYDQQQQVRYADLARTGAGTVQSEQQWASQLRQQQATLKAAQASQMAAVRQLAALTAQRDSAEANLKQATAQRDQAQLNLSYTTINAAQPGWVVQLSAGAGEYVSAGTDLSMFVPDDRWVAANFKETQLDHMRPGEKATIHIDAYPDRTIHGHVASVQPGSGTAFSLLPAQNATGNWVKIVQRVPAKIVMDDLPKDVALGPGMSVEATVRVNPKPPLIDRLESWL